MIANNVPDSSTLSVESDPRLDGYVLQFGNGGNWFYTPDEPPDDIEEEVTSFRIERKSRNFPEKGEAVAFGLGFEKDVRREL